MFKSIAQRLMINSVVVAIVTTFLGVVVLVVLNSMNNLFSLGDRTIAMFGAIPALFEFTPDELALLNLPNGFTLVVDENNRVSYVDAYPDCTIGMLLEVCAPQFTTVSSVDDYQQDGFSFFVLDTPFGYRVISFRQTFSPETYIVSLLVPAFCLTLMAIPIAVIVAKLTTRKLAKRLQHIIHASNRFANGDFNVRVNDVYTDDIGQIGQQFNSMADVLAQNIHLLRDLAHTNTQLMNQAEEQAIQLERTRLSRELHDDIAQKLFSLSAHSAILPNLIAQNPSSAIPQAEIVAQLAEQVNLDLRALLVNLRPLDVIHYGLSDALESLCNQWQAVNHIPTTCTRVLQGKHIPVGVQDAVYRIVQEALHNIAKHANAQSVSVSVVEGKNHLIISITDDGVGFDIHTIPQGRFGLLGIQERARILGGTVSIESHIRQGTTITIQLPIRKESRDD